MNRETVYLAGPIDGLHYDQAAGWRQDAQDRLEELGFKVYNPMSGKECLAGKVIKASEYKDKGVIFRKDAIVKMDLSRIRWSDIVLINFNTPTLSGGTLVEVGFATALNKIIIAIINDTSYTHAFVTENAIVVNDLEEAIEIITTL